MEEDITIKLSNRSFNYGDGFFETIKIINSSAFNFSTHFGRIKYSLDVLQFHYNSNQLFLKEKISHLISANNIINGSCKIHITRKGDGRYLPKSNEIDLYISTSQADAYKYNRPVSVCIYEDAYKAPGFLSNLKSSNSLIYVLASIYAKEHNFDNAILVNTSGFIIEATNANIFIVRNDKIYTPLLTDGCVSGIMRSWLLDNIEINEKSLVLNEILESDEIFITNTMDGVIPVNNFGETSFMNFDKASILQQKLINSSLGLLVD